MMSRRSSILVGKSFCLNGLVFELTWSTFGGVFLSRVYYCLTPTLSYYHQSKQWRWDPTESFSLPPIHRAGCVQVCSTSVAATFCRWLEKKIHIVQWHACGSHRTNGKIVAGRLVLFFGSDISYHGRKHLSKLHGVVVWHESTFCGHHVKRRTGDWELCVW